MKFFKIQWMILTQSKQDHHEKWVRNLQAQNDRKVIMMVLWMEPFAMEKESKKKHQFKKSFYRLEIKMTMV